MGPAFTIALLGAVESLLSAVVSDGMIGGRHRSNMELVAQGVANIASPLFGGIPATGAIADRKSGGEGKRGDLGGRRIIKKKKNRTRGAACDQQKIKAVRGEPCEW